MSHTTETERLLLRPMHAKDQQGSLTVFGDERVLAAFAAEPMNDAQMRFWVEHNLEHQRQYGYDLHTVVLKATGEIIGDCGLEHMTENRLEAELGYDFRSDMWGQGLATEAATAVRDHALANLGLTRLFSLIRAGKARSRRVAEKVGMTLDATVDRCGVSYRVDARNLAPRARDATETTTS